MINYYWHEYLDSPELKRNLVMRKRGDYYELYDTVRSMIVLKSTIDLSEHLHVHNNPSSGTESAT